MYRILFVRNRFSSTRSVIALITLCLVWAGATASAGEDKAGYRTLEWIDLIPPDDLEALSNPPEFINEIEDGSEEDRISNDMASAIAKASDQRYFDALQSTKIVAEFDKQKVRIPGFVVPLEFTEDQTITEFFLVPYFGACIHVPPPPPNQIIYSDFPKGVKLEALYDPIWIEGTMITEIQTNDLGTSAYTIKVEAFEPYQY